MRKEAFDLRYDFREELGRGGMGIVYKAYDRIMNSEVALKIIHGGNHDETEKEFMTMKLLRNHPHFPLVYDFGNFRGKRYIAQEWIEGQKIKELFSLQYDFPLGKSSILLNLLT